MKEKKWNIKLNDEDFIVEFIPNPVFKIRYKILVNNVKINDIKHKLDRKGADYEFIIGEHRAAVVFRVDGFSSTYDLAIDGISVTTFSPVKFL